MLSRRDVLTQLTKLGVKQQSLLKAYLRDFEKYMKENYGLEVLKKSSHTTQKEPPPTPCPVDPSSASQK